MTFNHQGNSGLNAQMEITSVSFNNTDSDVISGSNRGIINIWDAATEKLTMTLKGHTVAVNSLAVYPLEEYKNLLISGSYDTNIKLWDLRQKTSIATLKGHTQQINSLAASPDGKLIASGSQDGLIKLWDTTQFKVINTFILHNASVTCVKFNPVDMTLATGGADRTVKYWDLNSFSMISSTRQDATPIQSILFMNDGSYLFSAAQESLKVWNLEKDAQLVDNIESLWKGVQDITISDENDMLLGLTAASQQAFGLWACPIKLINFQCDQQLSQKKSNIVFKKISQDYQFQQQEINPQQNQNQQNQGSYLQMYQEKQSIPQNQLQQQNQQFVNPQLPIQQINQQQQPNGDPNFSLQGYNNQHQSNIQQYPFQQNIQYQQPVIQNNISIQQQQIQPINYKIFNKNEAQINVQSQQDSTKMVNEIQTNKVEIVNEDLKLPSVQDKNLDFNIYREEIQEEIKEEILQQEKSPNNIQMNDEPKKNDQIMQEQIQQNNNQLEQSSLTIIDGNSGILNFSSLIQGNDKEKFKQMDLINEILREHSKFSAILQNRLNYMKPIQHWWNSGNTKSALYAINQLNDTTLIMDALQMSINLNKLQYINIEGCGILLQKAKLLIESKYQAHIKTGLDFVKKILDQQKEEIITVKNVALLSKMDLAREERLQKYNKLIDEFRSIKECSRLKKIADRAKDDIGDLAKKIICDLDYLFSKINNGNNIE